jgi:hypothetical protein
MNMQKLYNKHLNFLPPENTPEQLRLGKEDNISKELKEFGSIQMSYSRKVGKV